MDVTLSFYQILCLLAVPSLVAVIYGRGFAKLDKKQKENEDKIAKSNVETEAVKLGMQALLRSQMINDFNRWSDKGYAPIYARENFENCWTQYHKLGANGVMNDIHDKFMELPPQRQEQNNRH